MQIRQADMDDLPHTEWRCDECKAVNSCWDGDCQFCDGPEDDDDYSPAEQDSRRRLGL